jgi:hypothetical protein
MRKIFFSLIFLLGLSFIFIGCEEKVYVVRPDHTPPSVPKGLYSITADEAVWLFWEENDEEDLAGYRIYKKKDTHSNKYYYLVTVDTAAYIDYDVKNGKTYYYGVTAFDYDGNESDLSRIAYDTPRPEGFDEVIHDYHKYPEVSGFDFSTGSVVSWNDPKADIFLEYDSYYGVYFLWRADEYIEIQDFGYTESLDDINVAPDTTIGWSNLRWVEAILNHSYIIWDRYYDHYAKLRITNFIRSYGILFDWAYQVDEGNPELAPMPPHSDSNLRTAVRKSEEEAQRKGQE